MLRGAFAAALTPSNEDAYGPYVDFLAAGGLDGLLALGTTGECLLFSVPERKRIAELFLAARGTLQVAVNAGAQSTADTVALAAHAAVLPARRRERARASRHCGEGLRPDPVLCVRARSRERIRRVLRRARPPARAGAEPRRHEGVRHAVRGVRAVPARRARRVRRPGGLHRPRARGRRGRRGLRTRERVPRARRPGRARAQRRARAAARDARALPAPCSAQARRRAAGRADAARRARSASAPDRGRGARAIRRARAVARARVAPSKRRARRRGGAPPRRATVACRSRRASSAPGTRPA